MELSLERKLFLEENINNIDLNNILVNYTFEEALYIIKAFYLPIEEITKDINYYDSEKPFINDASFVLELQKKYNVSKNIIINRIKEVRKINKQRKIKGKELKRKK